MKKQQLQLASIITFFILISNITFSNAQSFTDGLHIGVKLGAATFMGETGSDISGRINEFNNSFGTAYDLEISKYLTNHIEIGFEIGASTLIGDTDNPQLSAEGFHYTIQSGINDPIEYKNKLLLQKAFLSYYLRNVRSEGSGNYLNPFVKAGVSHLIYKSRLKFQDAPPNQLIFGKGVNDHRTLTNVVFFFGGGIKASVSETISLMVSGTLNYTPSDFLDVVYNYSSTGERIDVNGIYTEFKLGVFYNFGSNSGNSSKSSGSKKGGKSGKLNKSSGTHLPFGNGR